MKVCNQKTYDERVQSKRHITNKVDSINIIIVTNGILEYFLT